jgi:hypothetical protein
MLYKVHARQLVRILEEGSHPVPPELAKIAETAPVTKPSTILSSILSYSPSHSLLLSFSPLIPSLFSHIKLIGKSTMELIYGDYAKGADLEQMLKKPTKITFD